MPDEEEDRIVSGKRRKDDTEGSLRPQFLREVIGQDEVVELLQIMVDAAKKRSEPLDHVLFYGPPGIGKTTLSHVMAREMNSHIRITSGPSIERAGDLAAILTTMKKDDVLFIDEIHRLGKPVEEILYSAMEDFVIDIVLGKGPAAKTMRINLPKFTVVGATTRLAMLTAALRSRFGQVLRLDFYKLEAMQQIVSRASGLMKVPIDHAGADEVAKRSRGTPRVSLRLLKRVRDFAQVRGDGTINKEIADEALQMLGVDELGLDDIDRRILYAIIDKFEGGPVGLETIAASISEEPDTIMDVYEPYLLQLGFIKRLPRGRVVTAAAYKHLGRRFNSVETIIQEPLL